ncbi:P-loop containing nucleoside triphosphate hydrolase protein [Trametes coccinea BRFM310]|uniref:p-loop containing nucleoside triphosphate hydrolase protein n=1 Tax=Trametes coccinea (strain BRFM310) TaxID=1353009 RepID=A0A1Y2IJ69_TRAC3|nr:P-loop containing nucleoside triphosphate hydrolase protein [Trametes coccinea BRFM310]
MAGLFFRQFGVLFWKNWIVMSKHPWLNILRCFIMPVAYGIFLAVAQLFLNKPNNYGLGTAVPVFKLSDVYDGSLALIWADGTNGTGTNPSAQDIIAHITRGFDDKQLRNVRQLASPADIPSACPQNFNLFSECFAAVAFNSLPGPDGTLPLNYTLRADGGLFHIDVTRHTSDYERRVLPLQWAIDSAIIELQTGTAPQAPLEWPFTQETNDEQFTDIRLSYIRGLRTLLVLALFICYVGIAYQLPGSFGGERANLLTAHLKAMGLMDSARILSWHLSISLAYLPAWIIVSIIWHFRIFTATNIGLVIVIHLLLGLTLASWSLFVAAPFGKSPQLAAVSSTFLAIVFAILALVFSRASTGAAFVFSIVFPPGFYVFAIRAVCGFENHQIHTSVTLPDPDNGLRLLPLIIAAIIDVFLWPWLAVLWERRFYDARNPSTRSWWSRFFRREASADDGVPTIDPGIAISIRNLGKDFKASFFKGEKSVVTAVSDLSLEIPKYGIYVLLGSNGAGKSTTMSILAGLLGRTRGSVTFEGGVERPPRGTIGIVPQKNVLFPELTCYQTLRVWSAVKRADRHSEEDDIEQLLKDCDLGKKIHYNANALSGGQKRKLQLAIGLIGGSRIILVDECTSGVDPLSRRALWRTLSSVRNERTVVFTTHFLDEADLLADTIAVLAAPGRLVAHGTPVALKSSLGEGYTVNVSFLSGDDAGEKSTIGHQTELLDRIRTIAPLAYTSSSTPNEVSYHLKLKDPAVVRDVLALVEDNRGTYGVASYAVMGTSIEDIFLGLMHDESQLEEKDVEKPGSSHAPSLAASPTPTPRVLELTNGRRRSPLSQALTIFHKRVLIARRSWLTPCLAVLVAVAGSCIPIFFLSNRAQTCVRTFRTVPTTPLYLPNSPLGFITELATGSRVLESPPGIVSTLGNTTRFLLVDNIPDNATFVQTINQSFRNQSFGGVSVDQQTGAALFAWEATPPGLTGLVMLNLASNLLYNNALNATGRAGAAPSLILANYQSFPGIAAGTLVALKWVAFFGAAMAVYPAFFSLYVAKERRSSVQAMQLSNGLSDPVGLWLGHLLFDSIFAVINATLIVIVFAAASNQFNGLGFFWVVLVLYGIVGALFSYCVSLVVTSPLAAFAVSAGYQVIMFVLYLAAYLLVLTYAKTSDANKDLNIIHYTMSILSPVASALRASFVSVNLFSLLCDGSSPVTASSLGDISRYGGPILYLFIYGFVLFAILVWVDSGSLLPRKITRKKTSPVPAPVEAEAGAPVVPGRVAGKDVDNEAAVVADSADALRVLNIVKAFGKTSNRVVDNVSFGVSQDTIFALLGPNGAGKTTTFNIIRGDVIPDEGDVFINGVSVVHHPRSARLSLGVCPQFTAIDSQMTVREHLLIYGRLKGLYRGEELHSNVERLMHATSLHMYADRLASKLSGGNQRKLSLAIALIGNPSVVLIDEFSTGIDAKMKRDMWGTLRNVAVGKAIVITTHSMEEASALANKVGILAKKMLAVGTTDALVERYATYEVHFSCRTREEVTHAQELMAQIPGARMADDVATRFEVPIGGGMSLAQLFAVLSRGKFSEYTVERATLESVFLKVIRENNVLEEDTEKKGRWWRVC